MAFFIDISLGQNLLQIVCCEGIIPQFHIWEKNPFTDWRAVSRRFATEEGLGPFPHGPFPLLFLGCSSVVTASFVTV